uniref:Uncharacterized protein n=1 Tax=Macaca fascicularis TaxID=9541 RepID=A0A7N9ICU6_MACFA
FHLYICCSWAGDIWETYQFYFKQYIYVIHLFLLASHCQSSKWWLNRCLYL